MFWISNDEDLEIKKSILKKYNVIDEEGNILTPIIGIDLPEENHPAIDSNFGHEIQKMIKKFTEKEPNQVNNKGKDG